MMLGAQLCEVEVVCRVLDACLIPASSAAHRLNHPHASRFHLPMQSEPVVNVILLVTPASPYIAMSVLSV